MDDLKKNIIFTGSDPQKSLLDAWIIGNQAIEDQRTENFILNFDSIDNKVTLSYDIKSKKQEFSHFFGPGNVPGMLTKEDMFIIFDLCKKLPSNGTIVEIGSMLGKSAVEFAKSCNALKKDFKIIGIDSFNTPIDILHDLLKESNFDIPPGSDQFEIFKHYTRNYKNIKPLKTFFGKNFQFNQKISLVFEDSDHKAETLTHALPFWWDRLEEGGILAGHDYNMRDVNTTVNTFAILNDLEVLIPDNSSSIWYIEKNK
jgi:predicted O-methyltransferase YrrM